MPVRRSIFILATVCVIDTVVFGQTPAPRPAPPTTVAEAQARLWTNSLARWEALGAKIVAMARQFPQEKADFRFHADTRTFLEEVWHETFDQQMLEARLKGTIKTIDQRKLFEGVGRPRDLKASADELETVMREAALFLRRDPPPMDVIPNLDFYIEHLSVAYGKLAAMYRANGLVPPVTAAVAARKAGGGDR